LIQRSPVVGSFSEARPSRTAAPADARIGIESRVEGTGNGGGIVVAAWLVGAAVCASWLLVEALATALAFRGRRPVTDKAMLDLLEDCKDELGIRTYLAIIETPSVRAPALFGWIRPRLLLPPGVLARLSPAQLRHVFLHELAHLKRHDIALNWLTVSIQAFHWFNPLVWLAFERARADMELACDELALARLEEHESTDYGDTILELLDTRAKIQRAPMLAAIGEDAGQVKRRIQMVAAFKKGEHASHLIPAAILLVLGVVFMVDAQNPLPSQRPALGLAISAPISGEALEPVSAQSGQPDAKTLPIDAAMKSATDWLTLLDSGNCGQAWTESHSVVKGMISREAWSGLCTELLRAAADKYGAFVSLKAVQVEFVTNLPMGLGDGVMVHFRSKYQKGEYPGPKLLVAKDKDGVWRMVRSDKE